MFPKKADSNEYFASGRGGRPDVFVQTNQPDLNGGRGIRSIVQTPSGGVIKRQIGGLPPKERAAGIRKNTAGINVVRNAPTPFSGGSPTVNNPNR